MMADNQPDEEDGREAVELRGVYKEETFTDISIHAAEAVFQDCSFSNCRISGITMFEGGQAEDCQVRGHTLAAKTTFENCDILVSYHAHADLPSVFLGCPMPGTQIRGDYRITGHSVGGTISQLPRMTDVFADRAVYRGLTPRRVRPTPRQAPPALPEEGT